MGQLCRGHRAAIEAEMDGLGPAEGAAVFVYPGGHIVNCVARQAEDGPQSDESVHLGNQFVSPAEKEGDPGARSEIAG
jgi:hypothetical protein